MSYNGMLDDLVDGKLLDIYAFLAWKERGHWGVQEVHKKMICVWSIYGILIWRMSEKSPSTAVLAQLKEDAVIETLLTKN